VQKKVPEKSKSKIYTHEDFREGGTDGIIPSNSVKTGENMDKSKK
jgi:hypothetical protein